MVSVCLPSDAFLQYLPSYLGFSYLGRGVSLHGYCSKAQPLLLILDEGYLLTTTPPDLEHGVAPLGPLHPCSCHSAWMYISLTSSETEFLSCIYWPFVSLLFWNILVLIGLSAFLLICRNSLYIFNDLFVSYMYCKYFLLMCDFFNFYIPTDTFWWTKCSPIYLFFLFVSF